MIDDFSEKANAHWAYVKQVLELHGEQQETIEKIGFHYVTAMIHGFGHGYECGYKNGKMEHDEET